MGMKFDDKKTQWTLVPWDQMEQVVRVLMYGAEKYAPSNWMRVDNAKERYADAAMRHWKERQVGNIMDEETGLPHTAHAICCLLFLKWFDER